MVKIFEHTEPQEYEYDGYNIRYDTWNGVWVIDGLSREYKDKTFVDSEQAEEFIDKLPSSEKKFFHHLLQMINGLLINQSRKTRQTKTEKQEVFLAQQHISRYTPSIKTRIVWFIC